MMTLMRTTVTLKPEAEHLLREAMRQRGQSFKEALNRTIVQGLANFRGDPEEASFVPQTFPMGLRAGLDPAYLDSLDGDIEVSASLDLSRRRGEPIASG